MKALYQIRDDLADILGIDSLEASDGPLRLYLNSLIQRAQLKYYWRYKWAQLKQFFLFQTTAGMSLYPYTPGLVAWGANLNVNQTDRLFDGTNYQQAGGTGVTGAGAPAWNAQVGGLTVDGGVTWLNLGPSAAPPAMEPRMILGCDVLFNNAWLPMVEGIPPEGYTLTSEMYPQRYGRIGGYFEVWPVPDATYKLKVLAYQALGAFAKDTDVATLDDELLLLEAAYKAKLSKKFKSPDAGEYKQDARDRLLDLQAANHGNQRYIPGDRVRITRPMPKLAGT